MHVQKALLEKSAYDLMTKSAGLLDVAKTQHAIADKQHEIAARQHSNADQLDASADKLEAIVHSVEAEAVEIRGVTEAISMRPSPSLREGFERLPLAAASTAPRANSK